MIDPMAIEDSELREIVRARKLEVICILHGLATEKWAAMLRNLTATQIEIAEAKSMMLLMEAQIERASATTPPLSAEPQPPA